MLWDMGKKKKPGRPKTRYGKYDPMRSLRVPNIEWRLWKRAAEARGVSLNQWIRDVLNRSANRTLDE